MAFVAGAGSSGLGDLGIIQMGAGAGGRTGASVGGIPTTKAIRVAVAASGGNAADVRGPTRRPTFDFAAEQRRLAAVPRGPANVTANTTYVGAGGQQLGTARWSGGKLRSFDAAPPPAATTLYAPGGIGQRTADIPANRFAPRAPLVGSTPIDTRMRRAFRMMGGEERAEVTNQLARANGLHPVLLGDLDDDQLAGLSLGKILGNVKNTVVKAAKDTGHAVGSAVTSKVGQAVIGAGLAATGVGLPAAIAIGAGSKAAGELIKPGGNLGKAAHGAVTGAAVGAAGGLAGKVIASKAPMVTNNARSIANKLLPGNPLKPITAAAKGAGKVAGAIGGKTAAAGGAVLTTGIEVFKPTLTPQGIQIEGPKVAELPKSKRISIADVERVDRERIESERNKNKPFTQKRVAESTIEAGKKAKRAADAGAGKLDALNEKINSLEGALGKAQSASDAAGFEKISAAIEAAKAQLAQASSVVTTGSSTFSTAGNAAEGAAYGAVAGGATSGIAQWFQENKGLAVAGGLLAIGTVAAIAAGRSSGRSAPRSHRRRTA